MEWRTAVSLLVIAVGAGWTDLRMGKVKNQWILLGVILGVVLRRAEFFPGAVLFGDWTWTFDCMSLVNLEDRKGRTGESWFGRAFSSLVSIRSDCDADGTDRTLCPI